VTSFGSLASTILPRTSILVCSILMVSFSLLFPFGSYANVLAIKEWKGEYFKEKEGAVFVKTLTADFPKAVTGKVQIVLYGIIQQQSFMFSNTQVDPSAPPREIWKLPSGKYRVDKIELTDAAGVKRVWTSNPKAPLAVLVPRVMLSNLGLWTIRPAGTNGLNIKFAMVPNSYTEKAAAKDSSVAAVVNGFTGSIQKVIGGKKVLQGAEKQYSDENTIRATATFTRQIEMFYRIELFKHNKYGKDVMQAIAAFDAPIRRCYTTALESNGSLKGDLVFQVIASAKTGSIRQARKSRGAINDGTMTDCIIAELEQIPMPIDENMIGELFFTFGAK